MKLKYTLPYGVHYAPHLLEVIQENHTLIAGTTGAGKSVLENSILNAILCTQFPGLTNTGSGTQLILIDPKKVELKPYENIPHVLRYADSIDDIYNTLLSVRALIDKRLAKMQRRKQRKSSDVPIYIFIDELVDLLTSNRKNDFVRIISDCISISRCTNIYFVILTQAPNRKILVPPIVLNMNCKVALFCNDSIESRQIIGEDSACKLPFHGQAIVKKDIKKYKIEIPMYSEEQINGLIRFWEKQHKLYRAIFKPR